MTQARLSAHERRTFLQHQHQRKPSGTSPAASVPPSCRLNTSPSRGPFQCHLNAKYVISHQYNPHPSPEPTAFQSHHPWQPPAPALSVLMPTPARMYWHQPGKTFSLQQLLSQSQAWLVMLHRYVALRCPSQLFTDLLTTLSPNVCNVPQLLYSRFNATSPLFPS